MDRVNGFDFVAIAELQSRTPDLLQEEEERLAWEALAVLVDVGLAQVKLAGALLTADALRGLPRELWDDCLVRVRRPG